MRYAWTELESPKGRYDFAAIERDLASASRAGLQLVAVIQDKSFNQEIPTPEYLRERLTLRAKRSYTAVRWDPVVVDRMNRRDASRRTPVTGPTLAQ